MKFEELYESKLEENFGDFSKCEGEWTEISLEEVQRLLEAAYDISSETEIEPREYLKWENAKTILSEGGLIGLPFSYIREKNNKPKCPRCGASFISMMAALSRRDNKTEICSKCGLLEALEDFGGFRE